MVAMGKGDEKSKTPPAKVEGGVEMSIELDFRAFAAFGRSVVRDKHCVRWVGGFSPDRGCCSASICRD
jgi:hypothetical protein